MSLKILTTPEGTITGGSRAPMLANSLQVRMQTLLESAMSTPGKPAPIVRAAPDVVLKVATQQAVKDLHIIGNYHSVKDLQQN